MREPRAAEGGAGAGGGRARCGRAGRSIERELHGQRLCESPSKQLKFHTTQISEFKRGGRWVEKRERRRGREGEAAGWPGASASC